MMNTVKMVQCIIVMMGSILMRVTKLYPYLSFVSFYGKEIVFKSYFLIAQILRHKSKIAIYPGNANDVFYCVTIAGML